MTASVTSPHRRHCQPLKQRAEPSTSSNVVSHQAVTTKAVHLVALSSETVVTVAMIDTEGLWRRKRRRLESDA